MKTIRNIISVFLAVAYLAVSAGAVVETITPSCTSAGPATIAMQGGKSKDVPSPSLTQRRHVPLVKPIVIPLEFACPVEYPADIESDEIVVSHSELSPSLSRYYSSLSDRAPPLS